MEKKHIAKNILLPLLVASLALPIFGCGDESEDVQDTGSIFESVSTSSTTEEVENLNEKTVNDSSQLVTIDEKTGEFEVSDNAYDSNWLLENAEDIGADAPEFIDEQKYYGKDEKQTVMEELTTLMENFAKTVFTMDKDTADYTEDLYSMLSSDMTRDDEYVNQIGYYYSVMKESEVTSTYIKTDIRQFYVYPDRDKRGRMIRVAGFIDATINDEQTDNQDKDVANWFELHFTQNDDGTWGIYRTYLKNRLAMENAKFLHDPKQPEDNTYYISMVGWDRGVWNFDGMDDKVDDAETETINPEDAITNQQ